MNKTPRERTSFGARPQPAQQTTTRGVGLLGWLGLIFVGLKLAQVGAVASWSWWWVLAPFWGPLAVGGALVVAGGLLFISALIIDIIIASVKRRKSRQ